MTVLPDVSYVMPVLNEEQHVEDAVRSVLSQQYPGHVELVVALGPSKDQTEAILSALANEDDRIRIVHNPTGTIPAGMNLALATARNPVILRVDAHSEPADGYTVAGVQTLIRRDADVVGGLMDARGRSAIQRAVAWAYKSRFGIGGGSYHLGGEEGPAESAYLGIYKVDQLRKVAGYDETVLRGEDWDLCRRIKASGGLVWFDPNLKVTYWPRGRFSKLARQFFSTGVWRGQISRTSAASASIRYFVPPAAVIGITGGLALAASGRRIGLLAPAGYGAAVAVLAATAKDLDPKARVALTGVLPIMHMTWGVGFLKGWTFGAEGSQDTGRT